MPMAQTSDREVEINPDWAVQVIAAVMVPGPAISGAASGTSEMSVKFCCCCC